jgi:Uncharacterized protein conserved in bacteria
MIFDDAEDDGYKSRSQKKRESTAVQKIGATLTSLPKAEIEALGLPDDLVAALLDWKKFPGHEAKRRQMQYIGRIMRDMNLDAIEEILEAHLSPKRAEAQQLHQIETLRDTLVNAEDNERERVLATITAQYPSAPLARLRHLAITAGAERAGKKPPKAYRELFRLLRDMHEDTAEESGQE